MKKGRKYETAFQNIVIPQWPPKPREWGITMVADWGVGLARQKDLIKKLADSVDFSKLIFEIPLVAVQEVHHYQGYKMWQWLLETFGPRVNIANLEYDDPLKLATLRLGIGWDTSFKEGSFCRSLSGEFAKK